MHHVDFVSFEKGDAEYGDPKKKPVVMVFPTSPSLEEVLVELRRRLNWMEESDGVDLIGRYNVGYGQHIRWKIMPLDSEFHWEAYKESVLASQDKSFELFATKVVRARLHIDLNRCASSYDVRSPVRDSTHVTPDVHDTTMSQPPMTQCLSPGGNDQVDNEDLHMDGGEFEGDESEAYLHDDYVGDVEANCMEEDMDHEIPYNRSYAWDSEDEGPDEEIDEDGLTAKEANAFKKVIGRSHKTSLFRDLSLADKAIVDGGTSKILAPRLTSKRDTKASVYGVSEGTIFESLTELQIWAKDYAVKFHRPFIVEKSNSKVRYVVKCEEHKNHCPWVIRARCVKGGPQWKITSSVFHHRCSGKDIDDANVKDDHRQLTSKFIAYRFSASIKILPTYPIRALMEMVKEVFGYEVKYGKAWKAKQAAFEILYGGWEESYNRLAMVLKAMAAENPGMYYMVEPDGVRTRIYNDAKFVYLDVHSGLLSHALGPSSIVGRLCPWMAHF